MELDLQTQQYEHPYQQPVDKDSSQAYSNLNPQTREDKSAYEELDKNTESPPRAESQTYEEVKEANPKQQVYQDIADN